MSKNKLQEYFQKRGKANVRYSSTSKGDPHDPLWKSKVKLPDGSCFTGEWRSSKRESEKIAATRALAHLERTSGRRSKGKQRAQRQQKKEIYKLPKISETKQVFFIDMENRPHLQKRTFKRDQYVIGFASKNIQAPVEEIKTRCHLIYISETRRDLADHLMTFHIGRMIQSIMKFNERSIPIYIISADNFGACLKDILKTFGVEVIVTREIPSEA